MRNVELNHVMVIVVGGVRGWRRVLSCAGRPLRDCYSAARGSCTSKSDAVVYCTNDSAPSTVAVDCYQTTYSPPWSRCKGASLCQHCSYMPRGSDGSEHCYTEIPAQFDLLIEEPRRIKARAKRRVVLTIGRELIRVRTAMNRHGGDA
jgi:hypothetical protein